MSFSILRTAALATLLSTGVVACGGASAGLDPKLAASVQTMRRSPALKDAERLAPQAVAAGDEEDRLSKAALAAGDTTGAGLHAERALARYNRARVLARQNQAVRDLGAVSTDLEKAEAAKVALGADRDRVQNENADLEKKLAVLTASARPEGSEGTSPERAAARLEAAKTFVSEARLLCGAAELLGEVPADLTQKLGDADKRVAGGKGLDPAAYDEMVQLRAACLLALTKGRRSAKSGAEHPDLLLAELSEAGTYAPARDERGVLVSLKDPFAADGMAKAAEDRLHELGRVATAHPTFAVQIVVHDPSDKRAQAAKAAFASAAGGTKVALVRGTAKNRVDVVFVGARE